MNYFQTVFNDLDDKEQRSIEEIFREWLDYAHWPLSNEFNKCDHAKLIENIKHEHFLDFQFFKKAIKEMISEFSGDINLCLSKFRQKAYDEFLRKGAKLDARPKHIATIVLKDIFITYAERLGFSRLELNKLISKPPAKYNSAERSLIMKRPFLMLWFTWDEDCESHPHQFIKDRTAENLWKAFALSDDYLNKELLAFYLKETSVEKFDFTIYRPTWCDADFFDKFKPTGHDEVRWGQTAPIEDYPLKKGFKKRRPEGVAKSGEVTLKFLSEKIDLLTF